MIVGVTGAMGSYLARTIGEDLSLVSPRPRSWSGPTLDLAGIEWIPGVLDAARPESLDALVGESQLHTVINTVAITPKHRAAADEDQMRRVNADFPARLASACERAGVRLIHISTDAVFSGSIGNYSEQNTPEPTDTYGRTKLDGEVSGPGIATLRTTFFGVTPQRPGLLDWFLRQRGEIVSGYANYRFSPLSLRALAAAIRELIDRDDALQGVYHVGGSPISKLQFLREVNDRFNLGIGVRADPLPHCDRTLDSSVFWETVGKPTPSLRSMLDAMALEVSAASLAVAPPRTVTAA